MHGQIAMYLRNLVYDCKYNYHNSVYIDSWFFEHQNYAIKIYVTVLVYEKTIIYLPGEHSYKEKAATFLTTREIMRSKDAQCNTELKREECTYWTLFKRWLGLFEGCANSPQKIFPSFSSIFPLKYATWDDDIIWRGNYIMISEEPPSWILHLGFLYFHRGTWENHQKWLKSNQNQ